MGLNWGDQDDEPLPDWVYVIIAILCLLGLVWGLAAK